MRAARVSELGRAGVTQSGVDRVDVGGPELDPRPAEGVLIIERMARQVGRGEVGELDAERTAVGEPDKPDGMAAGVLRVGDIEIDLERRLVTRQGELVALSRTEWLLLQHLAANAGRVVLHSELLTKVWGPEYRDDLQYLRVWISRLRRKLGAAVGEPGPITTFQGIGYVFDLAGAAEREPLPVSERALVTT